MSNPFAVVCPTCDKTIKIKNQALIGKRIICPACKNAFRIEKDLIRKIAPKQAAPKPKSKPQAKQQTKTRKRPAAPAATSENSDDEWLSALSETESSGSTLDESEFAGTLPPVKRGHNAPKPKKKKREPSESAPRSERYQREPSGAGFMGLGLLGGAIGGTIAGIIGALIWGGIAYSSGYEIGWIAWGIGGLVGFGVLVGAGEEAGLVTGIMALVLANLSIFGGKVFAVYMLIATLFSGLGDFANQDFVATEGYMISIFADEIIDQKYDANETLVYPRDDVATFDFSIDYPPEIWQEAKTRWSSMSDAEKNNLKSEYEAEPNGNENYYISFAAEQVIQEYWEADKEVDYVDTDYLYDYPADVWQLAKTQWEELTPEQQAARTKEEESGVAGLGSAAMTGSIISSTWSTLGPLDGLWILLASFTAFRVGANEHEVG